MGDDIAALLNPIDYYRETLDHALAFLNSLPPCSKPFFEMEVPGNSLTLISNEPGGI